MCRREPIKETLAKNSAPTLYMLSIKSSDCKINTIFLNQRNTYAGTSVVPPEVLADGCSSGFISLKGKENLCRATYTGCCDGHRWCVSERRCVWRRSGLWGEALRSHPTLFQHRSHTAGQINLAKCNKTYIDENRT